MSDENEKVVVPVRATERTIVDKGMYKATISGVRTKTVNAKDGSHPVYLVLDYKISENLNPKAGGKFVGGIVEDSMPAGASPKSKLGKLLMKAGVELTGSEIDVAAILTNREVEIMVVKEEVSGRNGNFEVNRISDLEFVGVEG